MSSLSGIIIEDTKIFQKAVKKLQKRFKNIELDCDEFISTIQTTDDLGIALGSGVYKVRIANSDKHSGKSAGYRLITYLKLIDGRLYLVYIYDKSDLDNLSENQLDELIKKVALEHN